MTVTVTGTWNSAGANDPVPNTIVTIQTQAGSSGTGQQPLSQTSDDGYKDPTGGANSSGTHYKLETSSPFTITVSPTASISATATATATAMAGAAMGGITMTASVPAVSLGGTTPDSSGNPNILVGQQCTGTVSGIPSGLQATYDWSKISGTTFETWSPTTPGNSSANPPIAANSQASYYSAVIPATNPTQWYWNDIQPAMETVKCMVNLTSPAAQDSPISFTLTAPAPVSVQVPTRVMNTNVVGDGRILKSIMIAEQTSPMMNNGNDFGSSWATAIAMPAAPAPSFGTGQWCYCQLVTPGEYVTSGGMKGETTDTQAGIGLDAAFPYNNPSANAAIESADGIIYHNGDSPQIGPLDQTYDSATLTDTLNTYLMFKPPGSNASWVPLSESTWSTNFSAQQPPGGWSTYPSTGSVGSISVNPNFTPGNTFPKWTQIVPTGQTETFVPY